MSIEESTPSLAAAAESQADIVSLVRTLAHQAKAADARSSALAERVALLEEINVKMPGSRRRSCLDQVEEVMLSQRPPHVVDSLKASEVGKEELGLEMKNTNDDITAPFKSKFAPSDMRQLALVAHNHMKPAMKEFIEIFSEILKKFRITGTQTTMQMCKALWGEENPEIVYGLACTSGPLGGDAQIASLMCMEDLGGLIFFVDPLSAHPHQADIDSLVRLTNCGNVIVCANPTSAMSMMHTLKLALQTGNRGVIPSFFETLESPAVAEYKRQQELALKVAVSRGRHASSLMQSYVGRQSLVVRHKEEEDDKRSCDDGDETSKDSTKNSSMDASDGWEGKKGDSMDEESIDDGADGQDALPQAFQHFQRQKRTKEGMSKLYGMKQQPKKRRSTFKKLGRSFSKHLNF